MDKNLNNIPVIGERLNNEESSRIIKELQGKYPDIDIDEDIEHFIIKKDRSEVTFLKRKFLPTTILGKEKLSIKEVLEAEINGLPGETMKEKLERLHKNRE